ncbi:hypothetical protein OF83DRAFT_1085753 [Amylostereum chailletii]|nr:hypothetical protein OF83DRAFT_1085753 [Amylostereum chailletii]
MFVHPYVPSLMMLNLHLAEIRPVVALRALFELGLAQVVQPDFAMDRATDAYGVLVSEVTSWIDFIYGYCAFQRALGKLTAFFDWWAIFYLNQEPSCVYPNAMCGSIISERDLHVYRTFGSRGITAYTEVSTSAWRLDFGKLGQEYHRPPSSEFGLRKGNPPHDLPQWFYPPVGALYQEFERQARDMLPRTDPYMLSIRTKQKQDEREREQNSELGCLVNMSLWPSYICAPVECYTHAFTNINMNHFVKQPGSVGWYFPPIYLLWGP